ARQQQPARHATRHAAQPRRHRAARARRRGARAARWRRGWAAWRVACRAGCCWRADGAADAALARQHWVLNCMGCHTATGGGIPGKVPPLANSLGYFTHVPAGREYVMRVPGASNSALS
ncbi:cytochrome c, partial [Burkholderia cenocepacia]|nr:cytochrome c [Burkholderia cenocepacia]